MGLAEICTLISRGEAAFAARQAGRDDAWADYIADLNVEEREIWNFYGRCKQRAVDDLVYRNHQGAN